MNIFEIIETAKESFDDSGYASDSQGVYLGDMISEIADTSVPVYTSDILECASQDNSLATDVPECGPAFDGSPTPINIIAANIYDRVQQELYEHAREKDLI